MKLLENKNVLITGASRGIGLGIATVFAEHGANVVFTYSSSVDAANTLEKKLQSLGVQAKGYQSNAADFDQAQELVEKVLADFSTIDVLINNAGITKDNLLMRISEEDFDKVIEVNLKSVFNLTKAVQRTMLKQRYGSIINMSSVVGVKGNAGQSNYAASKAGVIGFSKSIALELGSRNIRCNVIAPGFIETEMTSKLSEEVVAGWRAGIPLKRGGTPNDVANACVFLASDLS
ncbi:MAG: 3-oxoacyl-[acyl-carrier-protein] reductase, partial [Bacteroidota bacterium]|nr:3-oxoacyl-[acyl-carrier-protein] reductase [Bacteroidota bacterium]